ncbi:hypothetical protein ECEC1865_5997, partial [Escherichia coli EC1865]
HCLPCWRRRRK